MELEFLLTQFNLVDNSAYNNVDKSEVECICHSVNSPHNVVTFCLRARVS